MKISTKQIAAFQKEILAWYEKNKRDLPWRRDRDPYHILVSEVMLQQTQVSRVIPKYEAWMKMFPSIGALAQGSIGEVLRAWSGLGYNRRALNLHRAAKLLVSEYSENSDSQKIRNSDNQTFRSTESSEFSGKGSLPRTVEEWKRLPGIGEYTARAVMCFSFDEQIAVVDTNIRKVILLRFKVGTKETKGTEEAKVIQEVAERLLPKGKAYIWNQALMDYAAAVLKKEKISVPKQTKFKGSKRYYRGKILRLLLSENVILLTDLALKISDDSRVFTKSQALQLVSELAKEGFVIISKEKVALATTQP